MDNGEGNSLNLIGLNVQEAAKVAFESGLRPHFFNAETKKEYTTTPPPAGFVITYQKVTGNAIILAGKAPETETSAYATNDSESSKDSQPEASPYSQKNNMRQEEVSLAPPKRKWKKISIISLITVLALALIGFGAFFTLKKIDEASKTLVPKVTELSVEAAQKQLASAELQLGTVNKVNSLDVPENTIMSQTPTPGTKVKKKTTVDISVSAGPKETNVPNLVGLNVPSAEKVLKPLNLSLGAKTEQDSDQPKGTIVFQSPAAKGSIKEGQTVDVVLSNGKVKVPSVLGQTVEQASLNLAKAGFKVKLSPVVQSGPAGTIVNQNPPAGKFFPRGTEVQITYTVQPAPVPTLPATPTTVATVTPTPSAS